MTMGFSLLNNGLPSRSEPLLRSTGRRFRKVGVIRPANNRSFRPTALRGGPEAVLPEWWGAQPTPSVTYRVSIVSQKRSNARTRARSRRASSRPLAECAARPHLGLGPRQGR